MVFTAEEQAPCSLPRILIAGFGNDLMADDGVGLAIIARLRELGLPAGVRAETAGTDALRLAELWRGEPLIWLVDALLTGGPPGTALVIPHAELLARPQRHATVHQLSLPECLRWLAVTYPEFAAVRYKLFGIEAQQVQPVVGLSTPVAAAVNKVAQDILDALRHEVTSGP